MPFRLKLGVGTNLVEFERQLGRFDAVGQGTYTKSFCIEKREFELTLKTADGKVIGVVITATITSPLLPPV